MAVHTFSANQACLQCISYLPFLLQNVPLLFVQVYFCHRVSRFLWWEGKDRIPSSYVALICNTIDAYLFDSIPNPPPQKQKRQKISLLIRYTCAVVGEKLYQFCPADKGGTFDEVTIGVAA